VIESKRARRLGAVAERALGVKLIAATQRDLAREQADPEARRTRRGDSHEARLAGDTQGFVAGLRDLGVTPHVAQTSPRAGR
jgi:hypothetical protein